MSQKEPIALGALVQIGLNAVLTLLVAFDLVSLNGEQTAALYGVANVLVVIVVAIKTRSVVFSPYTVASNPNLPALPGTKPGPTPQGGGTY